MPLSPRTKDKLAEDRDKIEAIVNKMISRIQREDHQLAEHAKAYWAGHIRSALGGAYGGLEHLLRD